MLRRGMPLHVLVVPDKFKGTLTAEGAARALARGWRRARPADRVTLLPMSDGGDGFGEVLGRLLGARPRKTPTVDAAHRRWTAPWLWDPQTKTAVIESAKVIGLALLPPGKFHPFQLDTFGLGAVLQAASKAGARHCVVGLGGSATNDGGFGLACALGWRFADAKGVAIGEWTALGELETLRPPGKRRWFRDLSVAVDVRNPLLGRRGATRVYGPQKGLRPRDFALAESCLGRLALVCRRHFGEDYAREPGSGAAGGLGFGFPAFAGASLVSGFDLLARHAGLEDHLRAADLVLTGEGCLDESSLMGKAAGQIALRCRKLKIPCIALAGAVLVDRTAAGGLFTQLHSLTGLTTFAQAKAEPAWWLERLAAKVAGGVGEGEF
jgi:glycerate kinase